MLHRLFNRIVSRESINSSPVPRFKNTAFRRAKPMSSKLNIPAPLSSHRPARPPPSFRGSACAIQQRKSLSS